MTQPNHPTTARRARLLIVASVGLLALTACNRITREDLAEEADASDIPVAGSITDDLEETPERPRITAPSVDDDVTFAAALLEELPLMEQAADEMSLGADAAESFDIDGAVFHATEAEQIYSELSRKARQMPGADSSFGEATIEAFDVCGDANGEGARALADFDMDALEASTQSMHECTAKVETATLLAPAP